MHSHGVLRKSGGALIRIDIEDVTGPDGTIGVQMGARDAFCTVRWPRRTR